ncbi:uncharacterized protein [Haliotis asinina]|uniref:uncharacterized protein n=1 Tax=Haliotis asinina TaxID=109174 RepID=UPI003531B50C
MWMTLKAPPSLDGKYIPPMLRTVVRGYTLRGVRHCMSVKTPLCHLSRRQSTNRLTHLEPSTPWLVLFQTFSQHATATPVSRTRSGSPADADAATAVHQRCCRQCSATSASNHRRGSQERCESLHALLHLAFLLPVDFRMDLPVHHGRLVDVMPSGRIKMTNVMKF